MRNALPVPIAAHRWEKGGDGGGGAWRVPAQSAWAYPWDKVEGTEGSWDRGWAGATGSSFAKHWEMVYLAQSPP